MRKIVFQMMTTLNGRIVEPTAWVHQVGEDQLREIDRIYATYDTVLVGRTTYEEMAGYWPGALSGGAGGETNRSMARRMNAYKKLVFSRSGRQKLTEWNNTEQVVAATDDELTKYLADLKAQPGGDIHLSGGASFAQSVVALGLVDEYHFFVYPVMSPGASWFSRLPEQLDLQLHGTGTYANGVVWLQYLPRKPADKARPESFEELLV
jgi:dihydrofolate reductase